MVSMEFGIELDGSHCNVLVSLFLLFFNFKNCSVVVVMYSDLWFPSLMYHFSSYFGIRALNFKTPRYVAKFITSIQIIQFIINVAIFAHLFYIKYYEKVPFCNVT